MWVRDECRLIYDEKGSPREIAGYWIDINERVKAQRQLAELVTVQQQTIRQLATPVLRVWDDVLVMPLVGALDAQRAQQIVENLLDTIVNMGATVVIMDITGVPVVDTKVANHFIKTIDAARMLGAEVILTGVSPHNAQTLVKLGVNLTRMTTRGSLQAGLKLAFDLTQNRVVRETTTTF